MARTFYGIGVMAWLAAIFFIVKGIWSWLGAPAGMVVGGLAFIWVATAFTHAAKLLQQAEAERTAPQPPEPETLDKVKFQPSIISKD
jgi:hypothetical protein